ncbi:MAG: twin-arginine translocase TatA/TatE family subunit [Alphaproteobacteria bacterium]|nr:twin-arginine translocase TatA/TatE family subunit [Alphaproteobacteria bacterium]
MGLSLTHIILLLVVVLVVFGVGKLPQVMGDLGKGVRNFKAGLSEDAKADKVEKTAEKADHNDTLPPPAA